MAYGSSDLANMLADMGEVVIFGAYTARAFRDCETDVQDMGTHLAILGVTESILVATGALPGLKKGSSITVAGVAKKVREAHLQDDGALTRCYLEAP